MEKSHVGMTICMVCGEEVDVLLDRQLKDRIPSRVAAEEPCDKCKAEFERYKEIGIVLFIIKESFFVDNALHEGSPWPHYHGLTVVTEDMANKVFKDVDLSKRAMFVPYSVAEKTGILKAMKELNSEQS